MGMTQSTSDGLLDVSEAAAAIGVSPKTIRRRIATGELPHIRVGRGERPAIRIARSDLVEYLAESTARVEARVQRGYPSASGGRS